MPESYASRGTRRARIALAALGSEVRAARTAAGLSLATVAAAAGISPTELSRVELGLAPWLDVLVASRLCAVVGLDLSVRAFPGGDPLRDAGHVRLTSAFSHRIGPGLRVRTEVPVADGRDQRRGTKPSRIADTRGNRNAVSAAREVLRPLFPLDGAEILAALGASRLPRAGGIVFIRVSAAGR